MVAALSYGLCPSPQRITVMTLVVQPGEPGHANRLPGLWPAASLFWTCRGTFPSERTRDPASSLNHTLKAASICD